MIVIGIDPSLSCTAVVMGRSPDSIQWSLHKSKPFGASAADRCARYDDLVASIMASIRSLLFKSEDDEKVRIFLEGYSFGSKFARETLGEFGGILRWHLVDLDEDLIEVQPTTLKKFVTGKGGAKKEQMMLKCQTTWGYEAQGNDDADAYGLFRLGCCVCGLDEPTNQAQREVVEKLKF